MRIDINACFGHWQYWDLQHKTAGELVGLMDSCGIDRAAALSLRGLFLHWRAGNAETLAAAGEFSDRLVPAATISPFTGGDGAELRRLVDGGMRGVRLYPKLHSYRLDDPWVDEICATAGALGVPVMFATRPMMNWRFSPLAIESLGPVVGRHPKTNFVVSGPNYLIEFQALVRLMEGAANVHYEFSCMQGFDAIRKLTAAVGAERVLFGTGAVLNYPACNVAKLDHAKVSEADREAMGSGNAKRLLGI
jgi:hypothetical protein